MRETSGELQYLSDTLLVENLLALEFGLTKQAGVLDILGGVAGAIKDQVKQHLNHDSASGVMGGVANLMAPAVLFRLHPIIGVLYLIGTSFGVDITSMFGKIMNLLKPKLEKGLPITPEEVNSVGKAVVSSEVGPIEAAASGFSHDMLEHLRVINLSDFRVKTAQDTSSLISALTGFQNSQRQTIPNKIPWFMGDSGASPIQKIFGDLFASRSTGKAKWLLGGFVVWIIKTVLAGAGLLAVTGAISNSLHSHSPTASPGVNKTGPTSPASSTTTPTAPPPEAAAKPSSPNTTAMFQASGRGEQVFPNDETHLWVVPLIGGSVPSTLLAWAADIYPELGNRQRDLAQTPAFRRLTELLQRNHRPSSPNSITMPKPFTSRKQVVDLLIRDLTSNQ
jgi:hypothetical protein